MRSLVVLAVVAGVRAANWSLQPFYLSLSAVDPVLQYQPIGNRTGDTLGNTDPSNAPTGAASVTSNGWELSYSGVDVPAENVTFSTLGAGVPKRTTSTPGATVTVNWVGTGVWFYGNTTDATGFDVTVDGHPTLVNGTYGLLGGIGNLPYKQHQAVLKVNSGTVDCYGATLTTGLQAESSSSGNLTTTEVSTVAGDDKHINPAFLATSTGGTGWAGRWDWAGTAWDHIGTTGQYATLQYTVAPYTSYLALYGGTSGWNGDYQVSFAPSLAYDASGAKGSEYSTWRGQDVILWAGPLDPNVNYTMTVKTLLKDWWIDVSKVKEWSALNSTGTAPATVTSKKSSTGAIVGGVVGGVALLALLLLGLFLYRRKKNRPAAAPLDIIDDDITPMPYNPNPNVMERQHQHSPLLSGYVFVSTADSSKPTETQYVGGAPALDRTYTDLSSPGTEGASLLNPHSVYSPTSASASSSSAALAAASTSGPSTARYSAKLPPRAPPHEITRQETDGGVVVNLVPPSYDPSWAGERQG